MITLTNPKLVNSILGGSDTVGYERFVLRHIVYDSIKKSVSSQIEITSTSEPTMQAIAGRLEIDTAASTLKIEVQQLDFYRQITLTGAQTSYVRQLVIDAQDALEAGLISVTVVDGIQTSGPN